MTRKEFFEMKEKAALWDVAVSIQRGNPLPLDSNSVFASYAELEEYAAGPLAYPGQIISVVSESDVKFYGLDHELKIVDISTSADEPIAEIYGGAAPTPEELEVQVNG